MTTQLNPACEALIVDLWHMQSTEVMKVGFLSNETLVNNQ